MFTSLWNNITLALLNSASNTWVRLWLNMLGARYFGDDKRHALIFRLHFCWKKKRENSFLLSLKWANYLLRVPNTVRTRLCSRIPDTTRRSASYLHFSHFIVFSLAHTSSSRRRSTYLVCYKVRDFQEYTLPQLVPFSFRNDIRFIPRTRYCYEEEEEEIKMYSRRMCVSHKWINTVLLSLLYGSITSPYVCVYFKYTFAVHNYVHLTLRSNYKNSWISWTSIITAT